jgi:glycosyltransferase domain-containing protein
VTIWTPELSLDRKIANASKQVVTPYVCISADDDFLAPNGVHAGVEFLKTHSDYVSVQGHYVSFEWVGKELNIQPMYVAVIGFHIDDDQPEKRIIRSMNPHMHHIFALHRVSILQSSLAITLDKNCPILWEYSTALGGMIYGKHKMLPVFWMARDTARYTSYNYGLENSSSILQSLSSFIASSDGQCYRERFADAYALQTSYSVESGRSVFDQAIEENLRVSVKSTSSQRVKLSPWNWLKKWLKIITPMPIQKIRRMMWKKHWMYKLKRPGFPFGDSVAKSDWVTIKATIMKFGQFPTVKDGRKI